VDTIFFSCILSFIFEIQTLKHCVLEASFVSIFMQDVPDLLHHLHRAILSLSTHKHQISVDMGISSGGPPNGAYEVHDRTDEMILQQNSIPDGRTTSPVQEFQHSQSVPLSHLIDASQPGEGCIKGHLKIMDGIDLLDRFHEDLTWSVSEQAYRP
jgi:hypothetical protein